MTTILKIAAAAVLAGILGFVAGTIAAEPHSEIVKTERALQNFH